jgi:hypothetical protein
MAQTKPTVPFYLPLRSGKTDFPTIEVGMTEIV